MPIRAFSLPLMLFAAFALIRADGAWGEEWYEHYFRAEKALAKENWAEATEELHQALGKRKDSGERLRTYGMNSTNYFPYWKLAVAYQGLQQWDLAFQAIGTEEQLAAITAVPAALAELRQLRLAIEESRQAQSARQTRRMEQIVSQSLLQARSHEEAGRISEAIETLTAALATAPEDPATQEMLERLQAQVSEREEQQARDQRWRQLVRQGRDFLARREHDEAARS